MSQKTTTCSFRSFRSTLQPDVDMDVQGFTGQKLFEKIWELDGVHEGVWKVAPKVIWPALHYWQHPNPAKTLSKLEKKIQKVHVNCQLSIVTSCHIASLHRTKQALYLAMDQNLWLVWTPPDVGEKDMRVHRQRQTKATSWKGLTLAPLAKSGTHHDTHLLGCNHWCPLEEKENEVVWYY